MLRGARPDQQEPSDNVIRRQSSQGRFSPREWSVLAPTTNRVASCRGALGIHITIPTPSAHD